MSLGLKTDEYLSLIDPPDGFEPSITAPKTVVLPLHHRGMAVLTGVEPAPNSVTGRHLSRLTSGPYLERITGIEPTLFHIGSVMPYQLGEIRIIFFKM